MDYPGMSAVLMLALLAGTYVSTHAAEELTVDYQRDNLSLNGSWQSILGHDDEDLWQADVAAGMAGWQEISVPGILVTRKPQENTPEAHKAIREKDEADKCVWIRRTFSLTSAQARRNAAIKWGGIRFGAEAWVNGLQITTHPTTGPHTALLPANCLKEGENTVVLKVRGWASLPMCAAKPHRPLVPTGAAFLDWGSPRTAIYDDIYLEFYDRVYLRWVLAMPDPTNERVVFRALLDGTATLPDTLQICAEVSRAGEENPLQTSRTSLMQAPVSGRIEITVSVPNPKLWSPDTPDMYTARFVAADGKGLCDDVSFRFGMRDIRVEKGHYRLNGKPLWLRGSNLVHEWQWGEPFASQPKRYLVDEARVMNLNSFRTHTGPMPTSWANVADENGIMVLAEMPVLQNFTRFPFSKQERDIWHKNVLIDTPEWITKLWNHPSIIMWVISNESKDSKWEYGPYYAAVKALDPTRPTMRTGTGTEPYGTPDNLDLHPCANVEKGPEGWLIEDILDAAAEKDPARTLTNSEYMNKFRSAKRRALMWNGNEDTSKLALVIAEAAAEHTEAMRRVQFDAILPYMYAPWTGIRGANWRNGFPTPMAAALHSSMAPVLASLDLFDRNYVAGQEVSTPLSLINELHDDVEVQIGLYITRENPLVIPDPSALTEAEWQMELERKLSADTIVMEDIHWKTPDEPGTYYLAAVLKREGARPVVSQRMVRSVLRADPVKHLKAKRLLVLGKDEVLDRFLRAGGADIHTAPPWIGGITADTVVICNSEELSEKQRKNPTSILRYVRSGGRLVILCPDKWQWKELVDFRATRGSGWLEGPASRVFPYDDIDHTVLDGIDPECLKRWNGLPGTISNGWISGKIVSKATKLLWQQDPARPVVASLAMGKGEVLICLLQFGDHIDPESPRYDPVAERVLLNVICADKTSAPH